MSVISKSIESVNIYLIADTVLLEQLPLYVYGVCDFC